jgi:hypothetical protein
MHDRDYEAPEVEDTGAEETPAVTAAGESPPPDSSDNF